MIAEDTIDEKVDSAEKSSSSPKVKKIKKSVGKEVMDNLLILPSGVYTDNRGKTIFDPNLGLPSGAYAALNRKKDKDYQEDEDEYIEKKEDE